MYSTITKSRKKLTRGRNHLLGRNLYSIMILTGEREIMGKKKILIVDDDKEFLEEHAEMLNDNGYEAIAFSEPESVVEKVRDEKPDLILLDLKMNQRNGFQIAYDLRMSSETAEIPICAVTAYYNKKALKTLTDVCGIQACVLKPFAPKKILKNIENLLNNNSVATH